MIQPSGRSVVLVVMDSARRDAFGPHTPNLWDLGERGIRFDRAIAPAGWTLPSHVSMFTGLKPTEHRVTGLTGGAEKVLANARRRMLTMSKDGVLLAPVLREHGIATRSASASPWVTAASGLDAGFDETDFFNFLQTNRARRAKSSLPKRVRQSLDTLRSVRDHAEWLRAGRDKGAARVLAGLDRFIGETKGPFFAFTTLMDTHEPHVSPVRPHGWYRRHLPETLNTVLQPGIVRILRLHGHNWGVLPVPNRLIERWRRAYEEEIAYLDRWLGSLLETLDGRGRLDETTIIVTADHGETWNENGMIGHGISLREGLANVPLVLCGAGVGQTGTVAQPVSLSGIGATVRKLLLDTADVTLLDERGRGFATMEMEDPKEVAHRPRLARREARGPGVAIYDGDLKLVADPFAERELQLFDLSTDPDETTDLIGTHTPTPRQTVELDEWRARTGTHAETRA